MAAGALGSQPAERWLLVLSSLLSLSRQVESPAYGMVTLFRVGSSQADCED